MTDTPSSSAPPGAPPWVQLVRPRQGRVFRGVCAGLGHATRTDPVLWRVLVVVLAFFGGSGVVLYLAGWFLVPAEGEERSAAQRLLGDRAAVLSTGLLVVLACLAMVVLGIGTDGDELVPLAVLGVLAYLVVRHRQNGGRPPVAAPPRDVPPPAAVPATAPAVTAAVPRARRRWGRLELLSASGAAVVGGGVLLAGAAGAEDVTVARAVAASLLVVGAGLLAGAQGRRSRRLVPLAVVLVLALGVATAVRGVDRSAGDRTWVVTASGEHRLGVGSARLDLTSLPDAAADEVDVRANLGMGELIVLVPDDVRAELRLRVGAGELGVVDLADGGTTSRDGTGLHRTTWIGPPDGRVVRVEARVGVGHLEVRRVRS